MNKVIGVKFKEDGRIYYFDSNNLNLKNELNVIVETEKGFQFGFVFEIKDTVDDSFSGKLKNVVRIATEKDFEKYNKNRSDAKKAIVKCNELIKKYKLKMKLNDASYTFDKKQIIFYFISEDRVDFRDLVKELASIYHCRIEMRQIGVRDKAKEVGGIGPCGRVLCCKQHLTRFDSVSIKMAKNQNLALNPTKINGACGRLLCCLKYEDRTYTDLKKEYKKEGTKVKTSQGEGKIIGIDVFNETYKVLIKNYGVFIAEKEEIDGSN